MVHFDPSYLQPELPKHLAAGQLDRMLKLAGQLERDALLVGLAELQLGQLWRHEPLGPAAVAVAAVVDEAVLGSELRG